VPAAFPAGVLVQLVLDGATYTLQLQAHSGTGMAPLDTLGFVPLAAPDAAGAGTASAGEGGAEQAVPSMPALAHSRSSFLRERGARRPSVGEGDVAAPPPPVATPTSRGSVSGGSGGAHGPVLVRPSILHPAKQVRVGMESEALVKAITAAATHARQELERRGVPTPTLSAATAAATTTTAPSPAGRVPFSLHVAAGKDHALGFRFGFPLEDGGRYERSAC
jgi:hypothetical protein